MTCKALRITYAQICRFIGLFWLIFAVTSASAHEISPALGELVQDDARGVIELRFEIVPEAVLAKIDLSVFQNTEEAPQAAVYDALRAAPVGEIEAKLRAQAASLFGQLQLVGASGRYDFALLDVEISDPVDLALNRTAQFTFTAPSPPEDVRLTWPAVFGDIVLRVTEDEITQSQYIQAGDASSILSANLSFGAIVVNYIKVGIDHIIPKGPDHILFVLGLFLLSPLLRGLFWQISLFTLAHSVTLGLVMTGFIAVPASIVEPLIALSIVLVAAENFYHTEFNRFRGWLVFGFGLLHGMGFASVLGEWGLPSGGFWPALIGFNVGVELGQIAVVGVAWLLLALPFRHKDFYRPWITLPLSALVGAIGLFWAVQRIFGF